MSFLLANITTKNVSEVTVSIQFCPNVDFMLIADGLFFLLYL